MQRLRALLIPVPFLVFAVTAVADYGNFPVARNAKFFTEARIERVSEDKRFGACYATVLRDMIAIDRTGKFPWFNPNRSPQLGNLSAEDAPEVFALKYFSNGRARLEADGSRTEHWIHFLPAIDPACALTKFFGAQDEPLTSYDVFESQLKNALQDYYFCYSTDHFSCPTGRAKELRKKYETEGLPHECAGILSLRDAPAREQQ